jgi:hypothetical protein
MKLQTGLFSALAALTLFPACPLQIVFARDLRVNGLLRDISTLALSASPEEGGTLGVDLFLSSEDDPQDPNRPAIDVFVHLSIPGRAAQPGLAIVGEDISATVDYVCDCGGSRETLSVVGSFDISFIDVNDVTGTLELSLIGADADGDNPGRVEMFLEEISTNDF